MFNFLADGWIYEMDGATQEFGSEKNGVRPRKLSITLRSLSFIKDDKTRLYDEVRVEAFNNIADELLSNFRVGDKVTASIKPRVSRTATGGMFNSLTLNSIEKVGTMANSTPQDEFEMAEAKEKSGMPNYNLNQPSVF